MRTVDGLAFYGRVPPRVIQNDIGGGSKVEAGAAGFQGKQEDGRVQMCIRDRGNDVVQVDEAPALELDTVGKVHVFRQGVMGPAARVANHAFAPYAGLSLIHI